MIKELRKLEKMDLGLRLNKIALVNNRSCIYCLTPNIGFTIALSSILASGAHVIVTTITQIAKTCLTGRQVIVQTIAPAPVFKIAWSSLLINSTSYFAIKNDFILAGLPLHRQKNLINLAFSLIHWAL